MNRPSFRRLSFGVSLWLGLGLAAAIAISACGDDGLGSGGDAGADLSVADLPLDVDLARRDMTGNGTGSDLAGVDFAGVNCGSAVCGSTQSCCIVVAGQTATAMCVPIGTCQDGGIPATCDGPEDCSGGTANCCANLALGGMMSVTGEAMCTATCPGSATQGSGGGGTLSTKLCHNRADCTGYTGTAPVLGNTNFDACCGTTGLAVKFCAPGLITALNNQITCD